MIVEKIIEINDNFFIKITYHENNDNTRLYSLIGTSNGEHETILTNFNRDTFLLKVNQYIKINNKIELLVASY